MKASGKSSVNNELPQAILSVNGRCDFTGVDLGFIERGFE